MTNAADVLVDALTEGGLHTYFGVPGVDTLPLYAALDRQGGTSVIVRHEATAAYAADAHFRVSGRPAACLTTGGPGAANTAGAMGEAWASSSTLLHLTTAVATSQGATLPLRGLPHFHPRQLQQFEGIAKWSVRGDDPDRMAALAQECVARLALPPHAPIVAEIPIDVLEAEARPRSEDAGSDQRRSVRVGPEPDPLRLDELADLLAGARAPIIWAGSGSIAAATDLVVLAEALGAPILLTYSAKRAFGFMGHPQVVSYPPHEPAVAELIERSDVMLAVGTDLDAMMTRQFRLALPASMIQIDIEPAHIGMNYAVSHPVVGDAAPVVAGILERTERSTKPHVAGRADAARRQVWADQGAGAFGVARTFLERLDAAIPDDAVIVCDMAIAGYWAAGYLALAPRRQLLYPMGWGTLGFGLPASIGAAIAAEGRRVVCISGDAGLLYSVGELATVAQHDLPLSLIVVDDGGYGMLRFAGKARFERDYDMDLRSPDFVGLGTSFGIRSRATDLDSDGVERELRRSVAEPGPSLLVLRGTLEPPRMSRLWE